MRSYQQFQREVFTSNAQLLERWRYILVDAQTHEVAESNGQAWLYSHGYLAYVATRGGVRYYTLTDKGRAYLA